MRRMDLTGQRIGSLTVLHEVEPYRSPGGKPIRRWLCRCDCGNETAVLQNALTSGKTCSCGCSRRGQLMTDMTGQRFGRLLVIRKAPLPHRAANGAVTGWLCHCDCGNEVVLSRKDLMSGDFNSCGCLLRETARKKVVEDNVFGQYDGTTVSAIQPDRPANKSSKSGHKGVYWSESEGVWVAKIGVCNKSITIGRFSRLDRAIAARKAAEEEYFTPILEAYDKEKEES